MFDKPGRLADRDGTVGNETSLPPPACHHDKPLTEVSRSTDTIPSILIVFVSQ
jgi:hypothetical protein